MTTKNPALNEAKHKDMIRFYTIGFVMGAADLVPGVSGGTIAFISGIYQDLVHSIKEISSKGLSHLVKLEFKSLYAMIPWKFLLPLFAGIFSAIFALSGLISFTLKTFPVQTWAFFFGLVVASLCIVIPSVKVWNAKTILAFILGSIGAFWLVGIIPVETGDSLLLFFLSGALAIMAMILPGISGSFILLILGKYSQVLQAVNDFNLPVLIAVSLGCVIGLGLFSRVLDYLFKNYYSLTMAVLSGFLLGSLRKVWPWKETVKFYTDSHGDLKPLVENNIMPADFGSGFWIAILLAIAGFVFVLGFEYLQKKMRQATLESN
jgi:putative membrane protein